LYLPSYSPDYDPIEEGFSAMKAWIRGNRDFILGEMTGEGGNPIPLIWDAVYDSMTSDNIYQWYRHAGYL
jgi:hypothetical protein